MLVYDQKGVEYDKEPCDVRECVAQGWTREAPVAKVEAPKQVAQVEVIEDAAEEAPVAEHQKHRGRPSKSGSNDVI